LFRFIIYFLKIICRKIIISITHGTNIAIFKHTKEETTYYEIDTTILGHDRKRRNKETENMFYT